MEEDITIKYDNGDIFRGKINENKKTGEMIFKNGDKYIGNFLNDLFHGEGTLQYKNGNIYVGTFINGWRKEGKMSFFNGDYYSGSWSQNKNNAFEGFDEAIGRGRESQDASQ
jgi:hypothetical protein